MLNRRKVFFELLLLTIVALVVITAVREFVARPFTVSGDSMEPTFMPGEYLVIDELTYYFSPPQRGDIVIFRYPLDPSLFFIKRLIGLPGDTVAVHNGVVSVYPEGSTTPLLFNEPYVSPVDTASDSATTTLDAQEYFVLGDNRTASSDSRVWGPVPSRYIIGRVLMSLYPFSDIAFLPGAYTLASSSNAKPQLSTGK